ncbi:MAG: COX15/CtaA family protein [Verrucomicrobiota bacterium]
MSRSIDNPSLHRFAVFTAISTMVLIGIGGLVTSHEAGMSVPDWPTSYGYNMFALPFKFWTGGAFHEHTHRLVASTVGLLTAILALWLWARETTGKVRRNGIVLIIGVLLLVGGMMGVRKTPVFLSIAFASFLGITLGIFKIKQTSGLRWFGVVALSAVVLQGILGGLRVVLFKDELGIFHATLAQAFLVLISAIALSTSGWWQRFINSEQTSLPSSSLRWLASATTILIFVQLILGATMRHQHAGLAIPDFPLAYGKIWPPIDATSIQAFNQMRHEVTDPNPITASHIVIHMLHRITAFLILFSVGFLAFKFRKEMGTKNKLARLSLIWLGMIFAQLVLGIVTVLKNKPADIATAHVVLGAASLVMGTTIALIARKISVEGEKRIRHVVAASSVKPASGSKAALTTT